MVAYERFDCGHEPGVCPGVDNEVSNFIDSHIDMIQPHPRSIVDYSLGKKNCTLVGICQNLVHFYPLPPGIKPATDKNLFLEH